MTKETTEAKAPPPEVIAKEMALDRAQRRDERQALVAMPASDMTEAPSRLTFMPANMGEAMQLATVMARSNFVPNHCRGNEGNCLAIVMISNRWGMDPFAVALKTYFVKDGAPPAFEAQLVAAVLNSSGALSGRLRVEYEGEGNALRCTVRGFLKADPNDEKVRTQSIARISTQNSPLWKSDPQQQLGYYTQRAWARLYCPEVLLGVYTPDEIEIEPERARVVSPARPSRNAPQLAQEAQQDDDEQVDADTGEVLEQDASGMTVVDEEIARELDAREGRADSDMGEANNGDPLGEGEEYGITQSEAAAQTAQDIDGPIEQESQPQEGDSLIVQKAKAKAVEIRDGIAAAKTTGDLAKIEKEYIAHCVTFPQSVADELEGALLAKKKALRG